MDRWIIVTGANGGMGRAITESLAKAGHPVVMACRNTERSMDIRNRIVNESGNRKVELLRLDLSSFDSIHRFVEQLDDREVGGLVNNAGIMCKEFSVTPDGLETTVGVNYVGPWLLTRLLLPYMGINKISRIINVSSCTFRIGKIDEYFFEPVRENFRRFKAYSASKRAILLYTSELADRLKEKSVVVNAVDPGVVNTGMITMHQWFDPLADRFFRPFIQSPEKGADTTIWLTTSKEAENYTGCFFRKRKERKLPDDMLDRENRVRLWKATEDFLEKKRGIRFQDKVSLSF
ncbi:MULTISPECIES: SDR family oxidoreductase [Porphyromonadaceae]|uniref:Uncharacterized protein n=1 Tax=Sanguibacteroides justesenii TaxID=1547597 RepID=A0A0C3NHQ0_9PORP|nr:MULTISPECIES: SDR family oxidoreductase [Porphyromonadaceae]KIO43493.1 hypothetical protein IE90_10190 [Sanguibacteroides justesenii]KIO45662.1 hypothetical protein BA92_04155 [Sanguibacteroides justesenii]PXZ45245.1 SDR family oxidoreductase [Sanguibacteroides justesenii]